MTTKYSTFGLVLFVTAAFLSYPTYRPLLPSSSSFDSFLHNFLPNLAYTHAPERFLLSPPFAIHPHQTKHHSLNFNISSAPLRPDGVLKTILTINDLFPGPTIEVVSGDFIEIVVWNGLEEGTSLHWHGVRIVNEMDGSPGVTQVSYQCSTVDDLLPNFRLLYDFIMSTDFFILRTV